MPYTWVQTELSKTAKTAAAAVGGTSGAGTTGGGPLERTSSQSSLVGKSIIYLDDEMSTSVAVEKTPSTTVTTSSSDEQTQPTFSMEELAAEMSRVECNDIFEPGPLSWLNNSEVSAVVVVGGGVSASTSAGTVAIEQTRTA